MEDNPGFEEIVQPGLEKLTGYEDRLTETHLVALGKLLSFV